MLYPPELRALLTFLARGTSAAGHRPTSDGTVVGPLIEYNARLAVVWLTEE